MNWFENKGNYIFEGAKVIDDFVNNPVMFLDGRFEWGWESDVLMEH
ncbi:MAG: hypothetical protein R2780_05840 [Crocinitomicaceae bacterium]